MAYDLLNPPALLTQGIGGHDRRWSYRSVDAITLVRVDGYFTNAEALGMQAGDLVEVVDTDATPIARTLSQVATINADGSADLTDGTAIDLTNTD